MVADGTFSAVLANTGLRKHTRSDLEFVEMIPQNLQEDRKPLVQERRRELKQRILELTSRHARPGQLLALDALLYGERDVLFQAATGYGKSMIWQCAPLLANGVCIMISPLNLLTDQQAQKVPKGARPIGITGDIASRKLYRKVAEENYTHICMSPELAVSDLCFKHLLRNRTFRSKRIFVIIDEVHVVDTWGEFREKYSKLWHFRSCLPPGTRMLGCSATLDDETRKNVIVNGGFRDPLILNTTTDRPEIYFEIRGDQSIGESYFGLRALIPDQLLSTDTHTLDKTIVFFDTKQDIRLARVCIMKWLVQAGARRDKAEQTVGVYYSSIRKKKKRQISDKFTPEESECRIMLATDAMGMGIEIEGVKLVIQYGDKLITGSVKNVTKLAQRMGRAARGPGEVRRFIWLVRPWVLPVLRPLPHSVAFGSSSRLQHSETVDDEYGKPVQAVKSLRELRTAVPQIYRDMCLRCPRKALLEFFTPKGSQLHHRSFWQTSRCCFRCHPQLTFRDRSQWTWANQKVALRQIEQVCAKGTPFSVETMLKLPPSIKLEIKRSKQYGPIVSLLRRWRQTHADKLSDHLQTVYHPQLVMPDDTVDQIARASSHFLLPGGDELIRHFCPTWCRRDEFASEVHTLLTNWNQTPADDVPETVSTFHKRERIELDQHFNALAKNRLARRIRRYGESAEDVKSALTGDAIDQWMWSRRRQQEGIPEELSNARSGRQPRTAHQTSPHSPCVKAGQGRPREMSQTSNCSEVLSSRATVFIHTTVSGNKLNRERSVFQPSGSPVFESLEEDSSDGSPARDVPQVTFVLQDPGTPQGKGKGKETISTPPLKESQIPQLGQPKTLFVTALETQSSPQTYIGSPALSTSLSLRSASQAKKTPTRQLIALESQSPERATRRKHRPRKKKHSQKRTGRDTTNSERGDNTSQSKGQPPKGGKAPHSVQTVRISSRGPTPELSPSSRGRRRYASRKLQD